MESKHQERVREFMRLAGQDAPDSPVEPTEKVAELRSELLSEETKETITDGYGCEFYDARTGEVIPRDAIKVRAKKEDGEWRGPDLLAIMDGHADVSVVNVGGLIACGIMDEPLLKEVDDNNLKKFKHSCPECTSYSSRDAGDEAPDGPEPPEAWRKCRGCGHVYRSGYKRADGKWVKPADHKGPDISRVLKTMERRNAD